MKSANSWGEIDMDAYNKKMEECIEKNKHLSFDEQFIAMLDVAASSNVKLPKKTAKSKAKRRKGDQK